MAPKCEPAPVDRNKGPVCDDAPAFPINFRLLNTKGNRLLSVSTAYRASALKIGPCIVRQNQAQSRCQNILVGITEGPTEVPVVRTID